MPTKELEFELHDGNGDYMYVELPVEWSYSYDPGKYFGRPEDCYPEEEESEIYIENMDKIVTDLAPSVAYENLKLMVEQLETYAQKLPEWAREEGEE